VLGRRPPLGRIFLYDDTSLLAEYDTDGNEVAKYDYGGDRLIRLTRSDEGTRYFSFDGLGSVTGLTDTTGAVTAAYHLDAWGNYRFTSELAPSKNRFGFTGHYWDNEAGLYYAKARFYDPFTARFTQADSFLGNIDDPPSLHRYFYGHANPTLFVDPTGHEILSVGCYTGGACGAPSSTGGMTEPEKQVGAFSTGAVGALWDAGVGAVKGALKVAEIGAKLNYGTMEQKADALRQLREGARGAAGEVKERISLTGQGLSDPGQLLDACAELGARGCATQIGRSVVEIDIALAGAKGTLDMASKGLRFSRGRTGMPTDPYPPDWARYYTDNPNAMRFGPGAMRNGELNASSGGPITDPRRMLPGKTSSDLGREFQRSVHETLRAPENTVKFSGATRSGRMVNTEPDLYGLRTGVTDIKDVRRISFDKQLQAQYDVALQSKQSFNLVTSPKTETVSRPLQQAIRSRGGVIVEYDAATGSFRNVQFNGNRVFR